MGGTGAEEDLKERISQIESAIETTTSEYDLLPSQPKKEQTTKTRKGMSRAPVLRENPAPSSKDVSTTEASGEKTATRMAWPGLAKDSAWRKRENEIHPGLSNFQALQII